ncbi:DNA-deoxyinosine glycosylase [Clostridium sp. OF03-18AA]|nr:MULTISPECIES: DNA-deoxyinosine glycosylase [unclassified Clostridium]RHO37118.1 DNA-deoxyinosine glycosylase [Clostridium sp. AM16-23]RHP69825.1 DNA-deoxyinosine glycosylase [Clostridium sp. OF03-18AA]
MNTVIHPIPPVFDRNSKILILGSFPSVKSREGHFFYHHPQNRFWKTLAGVLDVPVPDTIAEKKAFLLSHRIALWDVIASCSIEGSSDSSIRDVVPNDLSVILSTADIRAIFCNGKTSWNYYRKYQEAVTGIPAVSLPSTSPANAAWSLEKLKGAWNVILPYIR